MRKKRDSDEVSYWQPMADGIVGLLLIILLVLMLLMMYLIRIEDDNNKDINLGNSYKSTDAQGLRSGENTDEETQPIESVEVEDNDPEESSSSGGGGGDGEDGDEEPDQIIVEDIPKEESDLAAVFVQLMDEETNRTIKKNDIEFELYDGKILQALYTYYPHKTEYRKFQTDENGGFYLPQKIPLKAYRLHELTAVDGYDIADYTDFGVDDPYDWDEPYVVNVYLVASRNRIQISLKDGSDGKPMSGGTFQIIAAENIVTKDGTTRYAKNSVVDIVSIGSDGTGESDELYLGKYIVRQLEAQEYYALIKEDTEVEIRKKTEKRQGETCSLTAEKTAVNVVIKDELYAATRIENAKIELQNDSGKVLKSGITDDQGTVRFTDLKKNATYQISQKTTNEGYQLPDKKYKFSVDEDGYVNGQAESEFSVDNRMIRISVGIADRLFRNQVSDVNIALMDSDNTVIKRWNTTGIEQTLTGLTPDSYRIVINGNTDSAREIIVQNKAEMQVFTFYMITVFDIGVVVSLIVLIIVMIVMTVSFHRRRKLKKLMESEE